VTQAIVAVDGPAGAGKSSASRMLASRLGFAYVDTGSMYRAVGLLAAERGIALDDDERLARLIDELRVDEAGERLVIEGRNLSAAVRASHVGDLASRVSTRAVVRERLVALQRRLGAGGRVVMEGRDVGTVVFPDAALKVFLTATPGERAERRARELAGRGETVDTIRLAEDIAQRDRRDSERELSPLRSAADAVVLDTSCMDLATVVATMEALARERLRLPPG